MTTPSHPHHRPVPADRLPAQEGGFPIEAMDSRRRAISLDAISQMRSSAAHAMGLAPEEVSELEEVGDSW